ncbi:NucA/NucB deoxyribonuclease domain-containing protein [Streptomyces sp. NPDC094438]|uniref:NucA/NucB deoxyribonuclease domain-containing protein n=1 Tax=Streptomyces sp. NPDC094438 TaxID=3366061 RepID=UPI003824B479
MGALLVSAPVASAQGSRSHQPAVQPSAAAAGQTEAAKIYFTKAELDHIRKEGRQRAEAGLPATKPKAPQTAHRPTGSDSPAAQPPALDFAQAEKLTRQSAAQHGQTSDGGTSSAGAAAVSAAAPIGTTPDDALVKECFNKDSETEFGRVLNRFTYCNRHQTSVEFYEIDDGVPNKVGTTDFTYETFAQGDNTSRRIRTFARVQEDSVHYHWNWWDDIFTAPNVNLDLMASCVDNFELCHASLGPVSMPFVVWDNNNDWYYWDVYNHENKGQGRDRILNTRWYLEFWGEGGGYTTVQRGHTAARWTRCDSADYFSRGTAKYPQACIFSEVVPRLTYETASEYRSVAFHIFEAQEHPNGTYPLLVPPGVPRPRDKRIPGKYIAGDATAPGLHRIREGVDPEYKDNGDHKDGACYKKGPYKNEYLDTGLPVPPDTATEQCDEYPFASTLEGAANPYWDFSVKAVPSPDNSKAGTKLGSYYVDDRILSWDPSLPDAMNTNDRYYVHIQ